MTQQPQQQRPLPEPDDLRDWAARQPSAPVPWGNVWGVVSDRSLDSNQRILTWRILHGKLRVGAFLRRTGTGMRTRAQHVCPHACCTALPATLTHVFVKWPVGSSCGGMGVHHVGGPDGGDRATPQRRPVLGR